MTTAPTSPASISPDTSLSDLEVIRLAWIDQARTKQIPERLFEIGYWLGSPVVFKNHYGLYREFIQDGVTIKTSITQGDRDITADAWSTTRNITVYANTALVLTWSWHYVSQALEDTPKDATEGLPADLLFVPGEWTGRILTLSPKAEQTRIGIAKSATVAERNELARRMLVGQSV